MYDKPIVLIVTLTVRREESSAFRDFARTAAERLTAHGGRLEKTAVLPDDTDPNFFREVHFVVFPNRRAAENYQADSHLEAALPLRDRSVVRTEVLEGEPGPDYSNNVKPTSIEIEPGRILSIRSFAPEDGTAVVDLWNRSGLTREWNNPEKDIERKLAVQSELFLVAILDQMLIGTVMAGYEGHRGWVNYLAVDPKARRSGIARHLMDVVEVLLKRRGCPKLNLQMRNDNALAGAFYEAIGYREDETRSFGKRLIPD